MNASIRGIIDMLFKDTLETGEVRALHEEMVNNCEEHYADLLSQGLSETEALDAIVESLKGMKEVIDEYPKKPGAGEKKQEPEIVREEAPEEPVQEDAPDERDRVFSPQILRCIRTELRNLDLIVRPSGDGRIHVICANPEQITVTEEPDRLSIRYSDHVRSHITSSEIRDAHGEFSLKGILNFVGKTLSSVATSAIEIGEDVFLEIPERFPELSLNSMSGDIRVEKCLADVMLIKSTSGDIDVNATGLGTANEISAGSMSGDITIRANAGKLGMSSMSGDVKAVGEYRSVGIKSTSGDAEVFGCAIETWAHSVSGDVTVKLENIDAESIETKTTSGDAEIELPRATPSVHARMSTVSGDTRCAFPDAGAGAALQITASSVSGDVRIR